MSISKKLLFNTLASLVFFVVLVVMVITNFLTIQEKIVQYNDSTKEMNDIIVNVEKAKVSFKIQMQEWKDVLIRGYDTESFDKFYKKFREQRVVKNDYLQVVEKSLTDRGLKKVAIRVRLLIEAHAYLDQKYEEALKTFDINDKKSGQRIDTLIRGLDQAPIKDLDLLIIDLQAMVGDYNEIFNNQLKSMINRMILQFIIIAVILIITTVLITFLIARFITRPIINISKDSSRLAEGDLTITLDEKNKDEIGAMGAKLNVFIKTINGIITSTKKQLHLVTSKTNDLVDAMGNSGQAITDISGLTEEVKNHILDQSSVVTEITATIEEITKTIENQNSIISKQTVSVTQSSTAIEEMIANIQSINKNLENNFYQFSKLEEAIRNGNENNTNLQNIITSISEQSETVLEANNIIHNIASQTDLLAMNAAIEAAHAGEAGKGFAVVADEIRNLAESSNEQSNLISNNIKKLQDLIESAVCVSGDTRDSFNTILESVGLVSRLEREIKSSLHEQSQGSTEILEALTQIKSITEEVSGGSSEMHTSSKSIISEMFNLVNVTETIKNFILNVAQQTGLVREAVDRSLELLQENVMGTEKVTREVEFFTLDNEEELTMIKSSREIVNPLL